MANKEDLLSSLFYMSECTAWFSYNCGTVFVTLVSGDKERKLQLDMGQIKEGYSEDKNFFENWFKTNMAEFAEEVSPPLQPCSPCPAPPASK